MATQAFGSSIGFVSTYPPTECGLASFTASLLDAIAGNRRSRHGLGVINVTEATNARIHDDVVLDHRKGDPASLEAVIAVLNGYDAVSIQHEFGIFGGPNGDEVLDLVSELTTPTAVTLHTVLHDPTHHQRTIIERLAACSDRLVVMSQTALKRLTDRYSVDPRRIAVIPHGADASFGGPSLAVGERPLVLTWGLIGPGKGLDIAIRAFAELVELMPRPRYLIAGATHPNLKKSEGETYRESLISLVRELGLEEIVEFDNRYLDRQSLARLVRSADLIVLPYTSAEQVTSGVLVEAIAASKPVIATSFPHALELLPGRAGLVVPHQDPVALADALRMALTNGRQAARMAREAHKLRRGWYWPLIGERYQHLISGMVASRSLSDRSGIGVLHVTG
jgi:glycosyltransferase involved in cell wall biosynthesis